MTSTPETDSLPVYNPDDLTDEERANFADRYYSAQATEIMFLPQEEREAFIDSFPLVEDQKRVLREGYVDVFDFAEEMAFEEGRFLDEDDEDEDELSELVQESDREGGREEHDFVRYVNKAGKLTGDDRNAYIANLPISEEKKLGVAYLAGFHIQATEQ